MLIIEVGSFKQLLISPPPYGGKEVSEFSFDKIYVFRYWLHGITCFMASTVCKRYMILEVQPIQRIPQTTQRINMRCVPSPETNSLHLKMDGWKMIVSFWGWRNRAGANCWCQGVSIHDS